MILPTLTMTELLAFLLHIPAEQVHPHLDLREDLMLDDLDLQLLISSLERYLQIYLSEEEAARIRTVGDLSQRLHRPAA